MAMRQMVKQASNFCRYFSIEKHNGLAVNLYNKEKTLKLTANEKGCSEKSPHIKQFYFV